MGELKNLTHIEAILKLKELAEDINICLFCTNLGHAPIDSRPMSTQEVDEQGNIWFLSGQSSNKNLEISVDHKVQLMYADPSSSKYLSVYGHAEAFKDRQKIEEMWSNIAKAWFKEGKDDPEVTVIRVTPEDAYYWDTKDGKMISLIKIGISAISGKEMDGSVEGAINVK
jgi:general stress protein 26